MIANYGSNSIDICLGDANGLFPIQNQYATGSGSRPQFVAADDFNGDHKLDLAVAFSDQECIEIFHGNGEGSIPYAIAIGHLNNDTWPDMVVANAGTDNIAVFLGLDYATFEQQKLSTVPLRSSPNAAVVADFNNDHQLDVAITQGESNTVGVLLGDGTGSFGNKTTYPIGIGSSPKSIAVGDFNHDHRLDLAVTNYLGSNISVFLGHVDGSFRMQMISSSSAGSSPRFVAVGDFTKDTILDVVVANAYTDNIAILEGHGNGSFTKWRTYSTGIDSYPEAVAIGDFNHDSHLDVAVANYLEGSVSVFLGRTDGSLRKQIKYPLGSRSRPTFAAVADFNHDHRLDVLVINLEGGNVGVFLQNGTRPFQNHTIYSTGTGSSPYALALGDFNNDSHTDIAVANYDAHNVGLLLGLGNGLFSNQISFSTGHGSYPRSIVLDDLNEDTYIDLVVAQSGTDSVGVLLGNGTGLFGNLTSYSVGEGSSPFSVVVAAFDRDNRSDLAVSNFGNNNVVLLFGDGNGTFVRQTKHSMGYGSRPYALTASDFDKDAWVDIAIANAGTGEVVILSRKCEL